MSQPFKNIVNTVVFIRFRFFDFCMNFMIVGGNLDLILDTFECLGNQFDDFPGKGAGLGFSLCSVGPLALSRRLVL